MLLRHHHYLGYSFQCAAARPVPARLLPHTAARRRARTPSVSIGGEHCTAETWGMTSRAAILSLQVQDLNNIIQSDPDHAWLALCEPDRLFALRELCQLLGVDVGAAVQLVQEEPGLMDVPAKALEGNMQGIQQLLQLPRPDLLQLLAAAPSLLLSGPKAIEAQVARVAWELSLSAAGPQALGLLQLLPRLGIDALLDHHTAVQRVSPFISALCLAPGDALVLLQAAAAAGQDLQEDLLAQPAVDSLAREWRALSEEAKTPLPALIAALAAQLNRPDARYSVTDAQQLRADVAALYAASQLQHGTLCRMLLAAPRLARVPASFWQLLLQYVLFLAPQWRQQLEQMSPEEAGAVLGGLFDAAGCDVEDSVAVSTREALFHTADIDYNEELGVLEALLDQGMQAPTFEAPGSIRAGRMWRLIYLCNPRLSAAQQASVSSSSSSGSSRGGAWSWVMTWQLPGPLINQLQRQGALSCDLDSAPHTAHARRTAGAASGGPTEGIERLADVVAADTAGFCARHPGYAHWLHNSAFELEWKGSKAAEPFTTWDP